MNRPGRRPTLEQVAARAGVSRATASRVINGSPSVEPKLARRVHDAVAALGYVPNQAARSLMTRRTDTLALLAVEDGDRVFGDPFFSGIVRGAGMAAQEASRQLMLLMTHDAHQVDTTVAYLGAGHCDGVMLISEHDNARIPERLADLHLPVVIGGRPTSPGLDIPFVDNDNIAGATLAARRLVDIGRRRIATIAGPADMSAGVDRLDGFRRGVGPLFDPELVEYGMFTAASGGLAMERLLTRCPDLDAVFVASDLMALAALGTLQRAGRRVPEDVALIGFDDITLAAQSTPALTTVRQHTVEQGRRMTELLLDLIDHGADSRHGEGVILPVQLIVRDTA